MSLETEILAGKYRMIAPFAEGGMGELWLAEHAELETTVVVKRLRDWGKNPRALERFRREAKAAANLQSRHIIRVFDFGLEESGPYLVMERLYGQDVGQLIHEQGALDRETIRLVVEHTTRALRAAHASGVVHRDIKPSNLFLTREEGEPLVKVLDFGIAKEITPPADHSALTGSGALVGSPGYMSPEQVRGQPVDARSDVWSLGAVIYEMLTGRAAFVREHVGDSLARVCSGSYERVSKLRQESVESWDGFFGRAFSVEKDMRFQTVDEMRSSFVDAWEGGTTRKFASPVLGSPKTGSDSPGTEPVLAETEPVSAETQRVSAETQPVSAGTEPVSSLPPETPTELADTRVSASARSAVSTDSTGTFDAAHLPGEVAREGTSRMRWLLLGALLLATLSTVAWWTNRPGDPRSATMPSSNQPTSAAQSASEATAPAPPSTSERSAEPARRSERSAEAQPARAPASLPKGADRVSRSTSQRAPSGTTVLPRRPPAVAESPPSKEPEHSAESTAEEEKALETRPRRDPFTGLLMEDP